MLELKIAYKYGIVILIGILIFLLDWYNESGSVLNESILIIAGLLKSLYFIRFTFNRIKETAHKEFIFSEFATFISFNIALIVLSFAIDFNCLFRIRETAFTGIIPTENIIKEFIGFLYFSASTFTTAGFGDIKPNDAITQLFVMAELFTGYFYTILVIANIMHIRNSIVRKSEKA
ncbi:potassium channel family protein [Flavihumibacter fluvii]|uniref:potassium channel family protein n=1 Tax=Flavihumibacter fluvii TaxID=2838157 RepID=UPI001BDDEA8D|nr:potassium channel family protein [Flavihumibacter fluvii]ULQ51049.1 potassium channel family protein [Flavihumibacter fluvii]